MAKPKSPETIKYQIHKIRELEICVPFLPDEFVNHFQADQLDYGFTFDYVWDLKAEIFSVVISIVYLYDRENEKLELLKFIGQVEYRIHNLAFYIDTAAKGIKLPKELLASLTGIAISTVRGMISTRTYGKFQGEFYIPILNPQKVVQDYFSLADVKALH